MTGLVWVDAGRMEPGWLTLAEDASSSLTWAEKCAADRMRRDEETRWANRTHTPPVGRER